MFQDASESLCLLPSFLNCRSAKFSPQQGLHTQVGKQPYTVHNPQCVVEAVSTSMGTPQLVLQCLLLVTACAGEDAGS
jgi:hypothetical protein